MVLRMNEPMLVEDARNHPAETLEHVRALLAAGSPAQPDPRRPHFYELENGSRVYYIYISPRGGKVMLLATWPKDARGADEHLDRAAD